MQYHEGYGMQMEKWPKQPNQTYIKRLRKTRKRVVVADFGCGTASIAQTVGDRHTVHSFDLVAHNEHITACNIANVRKWEEFVLQGAGTRA